MAPKKAEPKKQVQQQQAMNEDDFSDLATLPQINEFVFMNLYSFKYKKNRQQVIDAIGKQFHNEESPNPKLKVISEEDIINHCKARQFLKEEEAGDLSTVDPIELKKHFAKSVYELILHHTVPLRRAKKEQEEQGRPATATSGNSPNLEESKTPEVDITIWLRDFPRSFADFQLLQEHQISLQAVLMIEEEFEQEIEDEDPLVLQRHDSTIAISESDVKAKKKIEETEFTKEVRIQAFDDLVQLNKLTVTCAANSLFRHFTIHKTLFKGPDPPMELPVADEDGNMPEIDQEKKDAEDATYAEFADQFKTQVDQMGVQICEYKHLKTQLSLKSLYPKVETEEEIRKRKELEEQIRIQKEQEAKRLAEEEEARKKAEEAKKKGGAKGGAKTPLKKESSMAAREKPPSVMGNRESMVSIAHTHKTDPDQEMPNSLDDRKKTWNFSQYENILSEMNSGTTGVGNILAAIVYQIEKNKKVKVPNKQPTKKQDAELEQQQKQSELEEKTKIQDKMVNQHFEDIFGKLMIEHSIVEENFKHKFDSDVVKKENKESPYQSLLNQNDEIHQNENKFKFLDGRSQAHIELDILRVTNFPGVNDRNGMPNKESIDESVRDSEIDSIVQFSPLPKTQTKRCLIMRAFEDHLRKQFPERTFNFLDRNFVEVYDEHSLRQIFAEQQKLRPEIHCSYYDKNDGLLVSIGFKQPQGRLLRRQWTYPMKTLPEFNTWKKFVKKEGVSLADQLLDISSHRVGLLRCNTKFSFPCDNSIIRVDKNQVGNRRLGTNVVIKDNLIFGIGERDEDFAKKAEGEDEIRNKESRKQAKNVCNFWLQFENEVRLFVEMVKENELKEDAIPPTSRDNFQRSLLQQTLNVEGSVVSEIKVETNPDGTIIEGNDTTQNNITVADQKQNTVDFTESKKQDQSATVDNTKDEIGGDQNTTVKHDETLEQTQLEEGQNPQESQIEGITNNQSKEQEKEEPMHKSGAKLTMTLKDGLVIQVLPNGDVLQNFLSNQRPSGKSSSTVHDHQGEEVQECYRVMTRDSVVIKHMEDKNVVMYFADGTITQSNHVRGIWTTTNAHGVKRIRRTKGGVVYDKEAKLQISKKVDPETNAEIEIREDGVLKVLYQDGNKLTIMPDGTQILIKKREGGEAGTITTITQTGYAPFRVIYDPVKHRGRTVIGKGGTDALMGKDQIMERTNNGKVSEVLLPDRTVIQTYQEKQELEGYNRSIRNMIHLIRRDDYSIIKVRQDGEVVIISANERAYLNSIGKMEEFGVRDYDYFFELYGVALERRSGVYTANIEQGKLWTQDEEGNFFIIYCNGDSVEKLSVSFDLDQLPDGIENKEPSSPRFKDGEYIDPECKFLPPSKTIADPRLIYIKGNKGYEFFNHNQLEYFFRSRNKDQDYIKNDNEVKINNEDCVCHTFLKKKEPFNPQNFDVSGHFPKIPQALELVNQTVSIPQEPAKEDYIYKKVLEFKDMSEKDMEDFENAIQRQHELVANQISEKKRLTVQEPQQKYEQKQTPTGGIFKDAIKNLGTIPVKSPTHTASVASASQYTHTPSASVYVGDDDNLPKLSNLDKLRMRIVQARGIQIESLVSEDYKQIQEYKKEEKRQEFLKQLDNYWSDDEEIDPLNQQNLNQQSIERSNFQMQAN